MNVSRFHHQSAMHHDAQYQTLLFIDSDVTTLSLIRRFVEGKFKIVKVHFQIQKKVGNPICITLKTVSIDTLNTKVQRGFLI